MRASHEALLRVFWEARDLVLGPQLPGPVVAAVEKVAVGAGLALALAADIAVVGKGTRLLDGHLRLGVAAGTTPSSSGPSSWAWPRPSTTSS